MTTALTPWPQTTLRRALSGALCRALVVCLFAASIVAACDAALGQSSAPSEEIIETTRTRAGELSLVRRERDEAVTIIIKLDGKVIAEKEASAEGDGYRSASLYGTYPKTAPRYALVSLTTGSLVCASKFTVVDLSTSAGAKATEDFGNCSDIPRVVYRHNSLTITFPAGPKKHDPGTHYVGPGQVWSYSAGRLRRVGR